MGKFLRVFFGCHARPDRSFYFKGKQFPICARCTGELVGILTGVLQIVFFGAFDIIPCTLLMLPMVIDGFVQLMTRYESTNIKRFISGFLFGIAFDNVFVWFRRCCIYFAGWIVNLWVQDMDVVRNAMEYFL